MNFLKDKVTVLAALATLAVGAGGYLGLISPQQTEKADLADQLEAQKAANDRLENQLPVLKARLQGITGQVDALRELSSKVPPQIDQAALYDQLAVLAARSGVTELTNVSVSVPQMVQAPAASAEPAPPPADDAVLDPAAEPAAPEPQQPSAAPVLAYYDLTMSVRGTTEQILAFLGELRNAPRINIVSSSSLSVGEAESTLNINARMFLQQVDVDGLAAQIEELAAATRPTETSDDRPVGDPADGDLPGLPELPGLPGPPVPGDTDGGSLDGQVSPGDPGDQSAQG